MKHLLVVSLISLAATPFGFAQTSTAADNKTADQEVRQMIGQYRTALMKGDTAALERIWADPNMKIRALGLATGLQPDYSGYLSLKFRVRAR